MPALGPRLYTTQHWTNEVARSTSVPFAFVRSSETPELLHVAFHWRTSLWTQLDELAFDHRRSIMRIPIMRNYQGQNSLKIPIESLWQKIFLNIFFKSRKWHDMTISIFLRLGRYLDSLKDYFLNVRMFGNLCIVR